MERGSGARMALGHRRRAHRRRPHHCAALAHRCYCPSRHARRFAAIVGIRCRPSPRVSDRIGPKAHGCSPADDNRRDPPNRCRLCARSTQRNRGRIRRIGDTCRLSLLDPSILEPDHQIMKLTSNTILITGGASGIGYELTKQLNALGNTILITGRDQAKLDRAKAAFPKIHSFRSDVSDPKAIATLYEEVTKQFPELNILINNAGIMREINVHDKAGSIEEITREIEINLSGPIRMVKQFLPHLTPQSEAAILNVSSGLAFVPLPISPVYCATKAGLHSFTESLRVQLKNTKVRVFELAPPATQTELLDDFNSEDMKGVSIMKVEDMVKVAVKGMQTDRFEIRPGQANQLKMMNRLAPGFILKQMSRSVDRMLRTQN